MVLSVALFRYSPSQVVDDTGANGMKAHLPQALAAHTPALDETNVKFMRTDMVRGEYTVTILYVP